MPSLNISVLYSSELGSWLRPATDTFNSRNEKVGDQPVHVDIQEMDDGEAMRSIASGNSTPTAWIPASSIWVNLLNNQWRANHQTDLLLRSGEYGSRPLVLTPMVFVMPEERAQAFTKGGRPVDWMEIQAAITITGGWKALGGEIPAERPRALI